MTTYAAGLRVSELCQLRIADLLNDRHQIHVVQAKGKKDRYTLLSPRWLEELRGYWRLYRPKDWLFPSRYPDRPLTVGPSTGPRAVSGRIARPRRFIRWIIRLRPTSWKRVGLLRFQRLLGHSRLTTTTTYLHVRQERLPRQQRWT
jgi:integrase